MCVYEGKKVPWQIRLPKTTQSKKKMCYCGCDFECVWILSYTMWCWLRSTLLHTIMMMLKRKSANSGFIVKAHKKLLICLSAQHGPYGAINHSRNVDIILSEPLYPYIMNDEFFSECVCVAFPSIYVFYISHTLISCCGVVKF